MHVDFGTGDGAFVRATAAAAPDCLVIGVDAAVDALRPTARKAAGKPAKGGLPNALFGRLSLEDAPGQLAGLADALTVLLPWGGLLRALARPDGAALARLRGLCKPGAALHIVFGYGPETESGPMRALGLPPLDAPGALSDLQRGYADAGLAIAARYTDVAAVRALPTTWAKRLAFSSHERRFVELRGRCPGP